MIITTFTVQQLNVTQTFPNHAMRTYKVTYEYRSTVTV